MPDAGLGLDAHREDPLCYVHAFAERVVPHTHRTLRRTIAYFIMQAHRIRGRIPQFHCHEPLVVYDAVLRKQ